MDKTVEDIYIVLDELLANIGLQLEEFDMSFLTQAELYVEMFKVMFPTLVPLLDIDFSQEDVNDQELIQSLLDFLSKYIIKMDLDHISGELITKGDPKHILNFLQLLSEISKMIVPKDEEEGAENGQIAENYRNFAEQRLLKSAPGSIRLTDQSQNSLDEWKYEKYNSAIGIPGEFHVEGGEEEEMEGAQAEDSGAEDMGAYSGARGGPYPPMKDKFAQGQKKPGKQESLRNSYSGSRISEVSKSKECSDYEMTAKKLSGVDHQFEDFDPKTDPERQKRLEKANADAGWDGQYEEEEEDEEIVEEADEDEEDEHTESTAKRQSAHRKNNERPKGSQPREEEKYEYEEEYEEEEGEGEEYEQEDIDQGEEHYQSYPGRKVSKESENYEGAEYYASDPINYQSNKRGSSREAEEAEYEEEEQEQEEQDEEEPDTQNMIQEDYEEEEEEGEHMKDEVIEDEAEYYRQQYQAQLAEAKKQKAARPSTAKPYKPGKVEYRPLRPTTAVTYMSHQSVSQAKPPQPQAAVKKTKKKTLKPKQPKQPKQPKIKKSAKSTSSRNHITEERISEKSRESTGHDLRGLQGPQQGSRRVTSKGSTREENSRRTQEQVSREQAPREQSIRYGESLKRRRLTGQQGTMQKTGSIRIKGDTLKKAYEDQQKMLYYNIRDSKLNYLKKIHTIIYQLEKEKIKEERELQRNYIKAQEEATVNILLTIKQSYQEKLDVLRQGYKNEKNERKVNDMAQHTFLKTLSHELRLDQMKEIERLKDRLAQEKMRFDLMTGDEAYLERKLAQLYQK